MTKYIYREEEAYGDIHPISEQSDNNNSGKLVRAFRWVVFLTIDFEIPFEI